MKRPNFDMHDITNGVSTTTPNIAMVLIMILSEVFTLFNISFSLG